MAAPGASTVRRAPSPDARTQANVWYAVDALEWHHARTGVDATTAVDQHAALATWREANQLDLVRLIRELREEERRLL